MSKTMTSKLAAADLLNQVVTAAVLEAGKTLSNEEIAAILNRVNEMLESNE